MPKFQHSMLLTHTTRVLQILHHVSGCISIDSKVVVDMIHCGHTNIPYLQLVLADIMYILQTPNMNLESHLISCDANKCTNLLAHRTHTTSFNLSVEFYFALLDIITCNDSLGATSLISFGWLMQCYY